MTLKAQIVSRRRSTPTIPPTAMVLGAVASVQLGSGIAKHIFNAIHPSGAVLLRVGLGALVLLLIWRPRPRSYDSSDYILAVLFGLTLAAMNFSFYSALNRIPLGVAVTFEFVGPLGIAIAGSRRALDLLWVVLAATGIVLLTPWGGLHFDTLGVLLALLAGAFWAAYIILNARLGRAFPGGSGLAIAMVVATIALVPVGLIGAGTSLLDPRFLLIGLVVALFSSVIPYSLELEALRRLSTRVFGVLMSTEPAMAAIIGFLVLGEVLHLRSIIAIAFVTVASVGASRSGGPVPIEP